MQWTMETGLLAPDRIAWLNTCYEGYKRGDVSEVEICGQMVQVYRGLPISTLRYAAAVFFGEYIEANIFPEMAELIAALQRNGCEIWAVSSTNDWVIEEGLRRFNIPANRVLAAHVEEQYGLATDRLIDVPTDEGKVEALRRAGVDHPDAVFGNSVHDAAMLAIARSQHDIRGAFPVNPSADLFRRCAIEGWPVFYPASVKP
jgi:phosphoserine phosphatase